MDVLFPIASGTFVTVGHFWWQKESNVLKQPSASVLKRQDQCEWIWLLQRMIGVGSAQGPSYGVLMALGPLIKTDHPATPH